jgi:hypothetical protein
MDPPKEPQKNAENAKNSSYDPFLAAIPCPPITNHFSPLTVSLFALLAFLLRLFRVDWVLSAYCSPTSPGICYLQFSRLRATLGRRLF